MIVYWEYAFIENFVLDGLLLYLALKCARLKVRPVNLILAAAAGGTEGALFPLFMFPDWCITVIKFLGGALLVVIAIYKGTRRTYPIAILSFFFFTFALGGLLTALYSYCNIPYITQEGYFIESAPVALVLAVAGIFTIACAHGVARLFRYRRMARQIFNCKLKACGKEICRKAFADSGNCLFYRGHPVCVISAVAVFALFGAHPKEAGKMTVNTVQGSRLSSVFLCERMDIAINGTVQTFQGVYFTTGEVHSKDYQMILHTAFLEGLYEDSHCIERMASKDKG